MPIILDAKLALERCPHCSINLPNMSFVFEAITADCNGHNKRLWRGYKCSKCGGIVTACAVAVGKYVDELYPAPLVVNEGVPEPAKTYLMQAIETFHAPAGSIMLCASAVDAMLKDKGHKKGTLNERINEAAKNHLITNEMALWAHNVRLDANGQRHADEAETMPGESDARKTAHFALALAEFLFVLPNRVNAGLREAKAKVDK